MTVFPADLFKSSSLRLKQVIWTLLKNEKYCLSPSLEILISKILSCKSGADVSVKINTQFCFLEHFRYQIAHLQYIRSLFNENQVNIVYLLAVSVRNENSCRYVMCTWTSAVTVSFKAPFVYKIICSSHFREEKKH